MKVRRYRARFRRLDRQALDAWQGVTSAQASDCLNRSMAMCASVRPIASSMTLLGQARTVTCAAANNGALHAAIDLAEPGDVLVVDAQGFADVAMWGGLMTRAAMQRGLAGIVVDGAVRDTAEIVQLNFPCFARARVPRGPLKDFGGAVDASIACAGVPVSPGDLIIGDLDGVTVVPQTQIDPTIARLKTLKQQEALAVALIEECGSLSEIYGKPEIII